MIYVDSQQELEAFPTGNSYKSRKKIGSTNTLLTCSRKQPQNHNSNTSSYLHNWFPPCVIGAGCASIMRPFTATSISQLGRVMSPPRVNPTRSGLMRNVVVQSSPGNLSVSIYRMHLSPMSPENFSNALS
ncbi:hypothetical protein O181_034691 [Austropuccinia psidii MF-1]|uniref:Uncharacterized protein n=1 Tax=Austropuccinia psidii MF-1 TaxID=1389203 RepID=A0A9Q3D6V9_9BASI|nr:hypothetical protein [Austropuccinia psidii MF-1]